MHGVDLGEVAPECASRPHLDPPHWIQTSSYLSWWGEVKHWVWFSSVVLLVNVYVYVIGVLSIQNLFKFSHVLIMQISGSYLCQGWISTCFPGILFNTKSRVKTGKYAVIIMFKICLQNIWLTLIWFLSCSASWRSCSSSLILNFPSRHLLVSNIRLWFTLSIISKWIII